MSICALRNSLKILLLNMCFKEQSQNTFTKHANLVFIYPIRGCTTMALGLLRLRMMTLLDLSASLMTDMLLYRGSVQ